jgi:hypothetical protein
VVAQPVLTAPELFSHNAMISTDTKDIIIFWGDAAVFMNHDQQALPKSTCGFRPCNGHFESGRQRRLSGNPYCVQVQCIKSAHCVCSCYSETNRSAVDSSRCHLISLRTLWNSVMPILDLPFCSACSAPQSELLYLVNRRNPWDTLDGRFALLLGKPT